MVKQSEFGNLTGEQTHSVSQLFIGVCVCVMGTFNLWFNCSLDFFAAVGECSSCVGAVIVFYTVRSSNTRVFLCLVGVIYAERKQYVKHR